ncbi:hypothetical protein BDV23DRAFT_167041 [Aspergillus alliaceus]|uniref:Uncharacterized protein n=1 Tax=Petromyces alliaceus TaxID=209559 RepID=A0A5N7BRR6_PETAA|nr:hypothetical protein BDV23DRAFT_167041 [Aspergillus alliaceus]
MGSKNEDLGCTVEDYRMAIRTTRLEKEYDNTLVHTAQLLGAEKSRIQRVEQLLLQFENEHLRWHLNHVNQELTKSTRVESEIRLQLCETYKELDQLRNTYRASSHEIERLCLELASLTNASVDSKKLLAEKLRLAKDLLKAEAEIKRLKSQKTSQHTLLAEKQTLERQLASLEIQLESDKKAHEETLARESQKAKEIATLSSKLEEIRNELIVVKRAQDQREHTIQQQSIEWAAQRPTLDAKFGALNKKLGSTKDQSQAATAELQRQCNTSNNDETRTSNAQIHAIPSRLSGTQHNSGLTIATPGAIRAQDKRNKISALPGDKSSFSITPFLNRTNGLRNSSTSSEDDADELHTAHTVSRANQLSSKDGASKSVDSGHQDQLGSADGLSVTTGTIQIGQGNANGRKWREPQRKFVDDSDPDAQRENFSGTFTHTSNLKTKKRKLGMQRDMSFFNGEDDDEDLNDMRPPGRKLVLGTGRNLASQISAPSGGLGRGRGFGGLAEFSPLKRDKKRL